MSREDWARSWKPWLRGTFIGFPIGALPAGGSEIPTFLSYLVEKKLAKNPEEFGKGAIEAVAGPEAANNASAAGVLAPLLALGLPTSATAAIMLAAFQQYGLQPGPLLFDNNPELVWGMIASLYVGNVLLLLLNLPMAGVWVKLLQVPRPWLYAGILVFATMGAYTLNNNVVDLVVLWIIGVVGFGMRVLDVPVAPCVVGLILGPLAEQQFRRALTISQGDVSVFFTHPISLALLIIALLLVVVPMIMRRAAPIVRPESRDRPLRGRGDDDQRLGSAGGGAGERRRHPDLRGAGRGEPRCRRVAPALQDRAGGDAPRAVGGVSRGHLRPADRKAGRLHQHPRAGRAEPRHRRGLRASRRDADGADHRAEGDQDQPAGAVPDRRHDRDHAAA